MVDRAWNAATSAVTSSRTTWVSPVRTVPSGAANDAVTGIVAGAWPSGPAMPTRASLVTLPTTPPGLATLNEPNTGSFCTKTAEAVWVLRRVPPLSSSGWPKATAVPSQTNVVVPTPANVTSP